MCSQGLAVPYPPRDQTLPHWDQTLPHWAQTLLKEHGTRQEVTSWKEHGTKQEVTSWKEHGTRQEVASQWRIQDFPEVGHQSWGEGRQHTILPKFPKNCMELKEFGPRGARPSRPIRSATAPSTRKAGGTHPTGMPRTA